MNTQHKTENLNWPRENAKDAKKDVVSLAEAGRSDSFILCAPPRTTRKRDFEQEATQRTEIQKAKSLSLISMEICRPFIRVTSSFESALCSLSR